MQRAMRASAIFWALAVMLLPGAAPSAGNPAETVATYEMEVLGLQTDSRSGTPMLLLRGKQDKRELTMFIGPVEANAIAIPLQGMRPPRPLTHDLLIEVIHRLGGKVKRVVVTEMKEGTYYANLILDVQGQEMLVDSRPSDAIALALRENAPILAAEPAFARSAPPESPAERGKP
jgi:bifunctional DNase/RNase